MFPSPPPIHRFPQPATTRGKKSSSNIDKQHGPPTGKGKRLSCGRLYLLASFLARYQKLREHFLPSHFGILVINWNCFAGCWWWWGRRWRCWWWYCCLKSLRSPSCQYLTWWRTSSLAVPGPAPRRGPVCALECEIFMQIALFSSGRRRFLLWPTWGGRALCLCAIQYGEHPAGRQWH